MNLPNKNCQPIIFNNESYLIVNFDPLLIVRPNMITGICKPHHISRKKIYTKCIGKNNWVSYQHYFATINMETYQTQLSKPFNLEESGSPFIEYVSGLSLFLS